MLIETGRNVCFHVAVPWSNNNIEYPKEVSFQATLYQTKEGYPDFLLRCLQQPCSDSILLFVQSIATRA